MPKIHDFTPTRSSHVFSGLFGLMSFVMLYGDRYSTPLMVTFALRRFDSSTYIKLVRFVRRYALLILRKHKELANLPYIKAVEYGMSKYSKFDEELGYYSLLTKQIRRAAVRDEFEIQLIGYLNDFKAAEFKPPVWLGEFITHGSFIDISKDRDYQANVMRRLSNNVVRDCMIKLVEEIDSMLAPDQKYVLYVPDMGTTYGSFVLSSLYQVVESLSIPNRTIKRTVRNITHEVAADVEEADRDILDAACIDAAMDPLTSKPVQFLTDSANNFIEIKLYYKQGKVIIFKDLDRIWNCNIIEFANIYTNVPAHVIERLNKMECSMKQYLGVKDSSSQNIATSSSSTKDSNHGAARAAQLRIGATSSSSTLDYNNPLSASNLKALYDLLIDFNQECLKGLYKASYNLYTSYSINAEECYSTSNLAFKVFRTNYQSKNFGRLSNNMASLLKPAYIGGYNQLFKKYNDSGDKLQTYYADVNSMYPYQMLQKLPNKYMKAKEGFNEDDFGFVRAEITVPRETYAPAVPFRSSQGMLIYPTGTIKGLYFSEEVKHFIRLGYKVNPQRTYLFEPIEHLFDQYVSTLYSLKKELKEPVARRMVKLLLNGLYGYLGIQLIPKNNIVVTESEFAELERVSNALNKTFLTKTKQLPTHDHKLYTVEYSSQQYEDSLQENIGSRGNLAMSAAITAYARIMLTGIVNNIGSNMLYADTDCVIYQGTSPIFANSDKIGDFKAEPITQYIALNLKTYAYIDSSGKENIKLAGHPTEQIEHLSIQDMRQVLQNKQPRHMNYIKRFSSPERYNQYDKPITAIIEDNPLAGGRIFRASTKSRPIDLDRDKHCPKYAAIL